MGIFNKPRRRAIAPLVLGLWIFALGTSIAHACGLVDQFGHTGDAGPVSAAAAHQEPGDETLPACDRFCADDIPLLSKLKFVEDSPAAPAVLSFALGPSVCLPAPPRSSSALGRPDPPPGIAVYTRFVRLAL